MMNFFWVFFIKFEKFFPQYFLAKLNYDVWAFFAQICGQKQMIDLSINYRFFFKMFSILLLTLEITYHKFMEDFTLNNLSNFTA
ncbi:hypothetical protein KFK09_000012 [Dendrobium nobile]|uniref:Uncharacterized protein n=1 Tax=Dendrobium nobile TaxID=94219 RepID=A0A8T3C7I4_DENNO|nr:hypothetical protein KFK09_000012 [Dendrobium nobile]